MLLHLIQDCSTSHVIDKIELVAGHKINSCLLNSKEAGLSVVEFETSLSSSFIVIDQTENGNEDSNFGIWFVLHLLDWVVINCATRQVEWCFYKKEPSCIKYLEDEEYDINMDEMFDCTQRLIDCMEDDRYTPADRHESLIQVLYHQLLPLITISQHDLDLVKQASRTQEQSIRQLDKELEAWNNMSTAYKSTMLNLQQKIEPLLLKYPQIRSLYPEVTKSLVSRLDLEMNRLKRVTLSPVSRTRMDDIGRLVKLLQKRRKSVSGSWKRSHVELLEETDVLFEPYLSTEKELQKVRLIENRTLSAKVKATQIKEELRNVQDRLRSENETYGYDIPSSHTSESLKYSHHSLYDSVLNVIQDVSRDVGREHMLQCNWIIEQCKLTELSWTNDPSLIPTNTDLMNYDMLDGEFLLLNEPDIFTVILDRISTQCAYTVGSLIKIIPRIQSSPAATKRLILTYETIIYKRVAEYIIPLFELRYKSILDQLSKDIRLLSWEELGIEEEWLIQLLNNTQSPTEPPNQSDYIPTDPLPLSESAPAAVKQAVTSTGMLLTEDEKFSSAYSEGMAGDTARPDEVDRQHCYSDSGYHEMNPSPRISCVNVGDVILEELDRGTPAVKEDSEICDDVTREEDDADNTPEYNTAVQTKIPQQSGAPCNLSPKQSNTVLETSFLDDDQMSSVTTVESKRSTLRLDLQFTTIEDGDVSNTAEQIVPAVFTTDVEGSVIAPETVAPSHRAIPPSDVSKTAEAPTSGDALTSGGAEAPGMTEPRDKGRREDGGSEADISAELDELLNDALMTLDEKDTGALELESDLSKVIRRSRPDVSARHHSAEPLDRSISPQQGLTVNKNRSRSAGAKSKWKNIPHAKSKSSSSPPPDSPATPQSPAPSPRLLQIHAQTRKDVESVLLRRRSRRFQSKRSRRSEKASHTASVVAVGDNLFTNMFKDSIQCLIDMRVRHSPLEKAQLLAKCLRCMSTTISQIRAKKNHATTSDDLITVAIVLLLNIPPREFRSVYVQLKFVSTYMDEFMDAGIHNFACVQFIGAMHFIQDQILTKKCKSSSNESKC